MPSLTKHRQSWLAAGWQGQGAAGAGAYASVGLLVPIGAASTVVSTTVSSLYSQSCDPRDAGTCIALQVTGVQVQQSKLDVCMRKTGRIN